MRATFFDSLETRVKSAPRVRTDAPAERRNELLRMSIERRQAERN